MEGESEWWQDRFGELRPWKKSDSAVDRLAWISISKLPILGWNPGCLARLLENDGKIVGYDKIILKHLSSLRLLNGEVHQVHVAEIESLNYPVSGAIPYTVQEFMAMPMLSQGEDEDDVDKDSDDMDDEVAEFGNFNSFSDGVAGEEILHDGGRFVEGANSKISTRFLAFMS